MRSLPKLIPSSFELSEDPILSSSSSFVFPSFSYRFSLNDSPSSKPTETKNFFLSIKPESKRSKVRARESSFCRPFLPSPSLD